MRSILAASVVLAASAGVSSAAVSYEQNFDSPVIPSGWFNWYNYGGVGAPTVDIQANGVGGSNAYNYSFVSDGNGGGFATRAGFYPSVAANPVVEADDIISFDIKATSPSSAGEYQLMIADDASGDFSEHLAPFVVGADFAHVAIPVSSLSNLATLQLPQLFLNSTIKFDGTIAAGAYTLTIDNFRIGDPIPEPTAVAVLVVAGAGVLRRRTF
jgi:hypothetical protein